jgi:hypothetical protein
MTKRIIGYILLIIASLATVFLLYRTAINPNALLIFKTLISGELGFKWTLGVILFHSIFIFIIYLLFKFGIKWIKNNQKIETNLTD